MDLPAAFLLYLLTAAPEPEETSAGDVVVIVLLSLVILFFLWLVVAAVRKKLATSKGRLGEYKEDEAEAARTARLWAEAKRKAEEEAEEEVEEEEAEEQVDIQTELLEKAKARREANLDVAPPPPEPVLAPQAAAERSEAAPPGVPKTEPEKEIPPPPRPRPAAPPPTTLEEGLKKTREGFVSRLSRMFGRARLSEDELEEIEEILFTADIGVRASQKLIEFLQNELDKKDRADPSRLLAALKEKIESMLAVEAGAVDLEANKPHVILVVGVNGTGKTTSIGKLAMKFKQAGKKVVLAAADTFRAAADEQLTIWGERAGAQVVSGQPGGDPGAVVYDAINSARSQGADIVIADTAGRLHTKINLIEELKKVHRVCGKAMEGAPHEVLLVLDATTGQNAINQAKQFHRALNVTGIVLTKLDGTAKGGVIIGICDTFGIPVRFIGIGEHLDDLRPFDPSPFVKALFS
jgi:fused signal recognition particle receptor